MKKIAPRYMRDFACVADKCRHSCCIGWEIDIDEESLAAYRAVKGDLGKRLAENISVFGENACFRLGADERCPFLNEKGLCDIYTELGEEALCQICTDHPRFYNEIAGRLEMGVGLCCEAAAELVLCQDEPLTLEVWDDDGEVECYDACEDALLEKRQAFIDHVQNDIGIEYIVSIAPKDWCSVYLSLERLDPLWSEELIKWQNAPASAWEEPMEQFDKEFRNLICYFLYRHLPGYTDLINLQARIQFAFLSYRVVRVLCAVRENCTLADLLDIARMYSAEIEYSEENTARILEELEQSFL